MRLRQLFLKMFNQKQMKIFKLPIYNNTQLRLAFEFGTVLSETAKKMEVEITPELMDRAEKIIINELRTRTARQVACDMVPLILASFEVN